jgi:hypothetical protein
MRRPVRADAIFIAGRAESWACVFRLAAKINDLQTSAGIVGIPDVLTHFSMRRTLARAFSTAHPAAGGAVKRSA